MRNQEEDKVIAFLKSYRINDLLFFKNQMEGMTLLVPLIGQEGFVDDVVSSEKLNILQLAIMLDLPKVVRYIL